VAILTRTLHPLPFEHLEPKRFEDLVRQLAYDFRPWRALEATGTGGADDSFDIRGWEVVGSQLLVEEGEDEENTREERLAVENDRLWLIQCKRELEIGPKKLASYVDAIPEEEAKKLYGVIIAASCTFSKKARDQFRERCAALGVRECHLWSRSELEDMLFQPKNDGILFAYFGFSLTIRRRTIVSQVRAKLAAKRKAVRAFESHSFISRPVLLLDVNSEYPYRDHKKVPLNELTWRKVIAIEHYPGGIKMQISTFSAYIGSDEKSWDIAPFVDEALRADECFWTSVEERDVYRSRLSELQNFMEQLPRECRANCEVIGYLPYERIIDIDGYGDNLTSCPIIYIEFVKPGLLGISADAIIKPRPFLNTDEPNKPRLERGKPIELYVDERDIDRLPVFPEHMRKKVW
jgi:Restriction endonuclease